MNPTAISRTERLRAYRKRARPYAVFMHIWGTFGVVSAILFFFEQWRDLSAYRLAAVAAAILLSIGSVWFSGRSALRRAALASWTVPLLSAAMLASSVAILERVQAIDPFFSPLLRAFLLAAGYTLLSCYWGWPMLLIGVWLFGCASVTAWLYLGYSPLLLDGLSGLSLIVCGWLSRLWSGPKRTRARKKKRVPRHTRQFQGGSHDNES